MIKNDWLGIKYMERAAQSDLQNILIKYFQISEKKMKKKNLPVNEWHSTQDGNNLVKICKTLLTLNYLKLERHHN